MAAISNPVKGKPMTASAEGKGTALVTGANSGLGKAIATALATDGMRVGLVARDRVRGDGGAGGHPRRHRQRRSASFRRRSGGTVGDPRPGAIGAPTFRATAPAGEQCRHSLSRAAAQPRRHRVRAGGEPPRPVSPHQPAARSAQGERPGADRQRRHTHEHGNGFRRSELERAPLPHDAGLRSVQARQPAFHLRTGAPAARAAA